jgi:hypothetical protein
VVLATAAFFLAGSFGGGVAAGAQSLENSYCLGCHGNAGMEMPLESGETLSLSVDAEAFTASVHGETGVSCVLCHTDIGEYPHEVAASPSLREQTLKRYAQCRQCHEEQYLATEDNVHAAARAAGQPQAAVCTDCHGAHAVQRVARSGTAIVETCGNCHGAVYDLYAGSVHGEALNTGNPDVPTCTDCHGVHDLEGPSRPEFHLFSPQICAECHADKELMQQYGISTAVLDTYVADFHGSTVILYEAIAPGQQTNKPVCIDCHGVHGIIAADDPDSTVFRENILQTCQRCHPDATAGFDASWLGHYPPDLERHPTVFLVDLFYTIIIPLVIGAMVLYVLLDFVRRRRERGKAVEA